MIINNIIVTINSNCNNNNINKNIKIKLKIYNLVIIIVLVKVLSLSMNSLHYKMSYKINKKILIFKEKIFNIVTKKHKKLTMIDLYILLF